MESRGDWRGVCVVAEWSKLALASFEVEINHTETKGLIRMSDEQPKHEHDEYEGGAAPNEGDPAPPPPKPPK